MMEATATATAQARFAWVSLTRLCGCNYKVPVARKGKSIIIVVDPQRRDTRYRIDAARFDAGERQFRGSWCIEAWSDKAARTMESERDWQT
jgi:hypothetical protein